jgi:hypothetical protein
MLTFNRLVVFAFLAVALGRCAAMQGAAAGTWTGTVGGGAIKPIGVRFVLVDESGKLSGTVSFQDPVTLKFGVDGSLTGTRTGNAAKWTTETEIVVAGSFENDTFIGTLEFPSDEGRPTKSIPVTLSKW